MKRVAWLVVVYVLMGRSNKSLSDPPIALSTNKSESEAIGSWHYWQSDERIFRWKIDYVIKVDDEAGTVEKLRLFTSPAPCEKECLIKL